MSVTITNNIITLTSPATIVWGLFLKSTSGLNRILGTQHFDAGSYQMEWDGRDQAGILVDPSLYEIGLIAHNVSGTPQRGIGNSSTAAEGPTRVKTTYDTATCIAFTPDKQNMILSLGYSEGGNPLVVMNTNDYGSRVPFLEGRSQPWTYFCACTDEVYLFACSTNSLDESNTATLGRGGKQTFVLGFRRDTLARIVYAYGDSTLHHAQTSDTISCIGVRTDSSFTSSETEVSGLCIYGDYIFLSRKNLNLVDTLDLTTGQLLHSYTVTKPGAITADASCVWLIQQDGSKVQQLSVSNNGTLSLGSVAITSCTSARSVSVVNNELVVLESGDQQRPRGYSLTTGERIWDDFEQNGFATSTVVNDRKFLLQYLGTFQAPDGSGLDAGGVDSVVAVCANADGGFSVTDANNNRIQFYNSARQWVRTQSWLPATYFAQFVLDAPRLVVINFSLYAYTDDSWTLTHNYSYNLRDFPGYPNTFRGLCNPWKHSTGRMYATIELNETQEVELSDTGLRLMDTTAKEAGYGLFVARGSSTNAPGSLYQYNNQGYGTSLILKESALTGIATNGDPIRSAPTEVFRSPQQVDPGYFMGPSGILPNCIDDGYLLLFDPFAPVEYVTIGGINYPSTPDNNPNYKIGRGPHLIAYKFSQKDTNGFNQPLYLTAYATPAREVYVGPYPTNGMFDIGSLYPGGATMIDGGFGVWNHHGEFDHNTGQTNKHHLYHVASGLPLCIVGWPLPIAYHRTLAELGLGGNAQNSSIQRIADDRIDLVCGDESHRAEIQRFVITGISNIALLKVQAVSYSRPISYRNLLSIASNSKLVNGGGWKCLPSDPSIQWEVRTNAQALPIDPPDLYVKLNATQVVGSLQNTPCVVSRDLRYSELTGTYTAIGSDWQLRMDLTFQHSSRLEPYALRHDLLDTSGRVLVRLAAKLIGTGDNQYITLTANGIQLFDLADCANVEHTFAILRAPLPLVLTRVNGGISIQYHTFTPLLTTPLHPQGNADQIATWQVIAWTNGGNALSASSIQRMRMTSTVPSLSTSSVAILSRNGREAVVQLGQQNKEFYQAGGTVLVRVAETSQHAAGIFLQLKKPTGTIPASLLTFSTYSGTLTENPTGVFTGPITGKLTTMVSPTQGGVLSVQVPDVGIQVELAASDGDGGNQPSGNLLRLFTSTDYASYAAGANGVFNNTQELPELVTRQAGDIMQLVVRRNSDGTASLTAQVVRNQVIYIDPYFQAMPIAAGATIYLYAKAANSSSKLYYPTWKPSY